MRLYKQHLLLTCLRAGELRVFPHLSPPPVGERERERLCFGFSPSFGGSGMREGELLLHYLEIMRHLCRRSQHDGGRAVFLGG